MNKLTLLLSGFTGAALLAMTGVGVANAAPARRANSDVGGSSIPRTVFKAERLDAAATVLHTSTANVQSAHKAKTFSQLVNQAGLTKKTYAQKLKAQLATDLESKGYSQDQVTIALQHKTIHHLHRNDKKSSQS